MFLFNDALNTFYLWLYGVRHMVKEGRKCFYLTTHSTHFILFTVIWRQTYSKGRKEMILFNDTLHTFYLRLYGVRHMVKEGRKCFYLTTHSTHFILFTVIWHQTYSQGRKCALHTFCLWLYGIRHMVKEGNVFI